MTAIMDNVKTKTCSVCAVEKPLDDFYRHKSTKDGRQSFCKQCNSERITKNYAIEKKGNASVKRSVRFLRGHVDPSELSDDEILGGFIYEDDGTKVSAASFEDKAQGKFNKELSRRLNRYLKQKSGRALEVIFEIIDSDLVEPEARLKASQWWIERIIGKTPEKLELSVNDAPHENIFESLSGGSRESHRAQAIGQAIDAEIVDAEEVENDSKLAHSDTGQPDTGGMDSNERITVGQNVEQNLRSDDSRTVENSDSLAQPTDVVSTESVADDIVAKREEAKSLKKRISDQKRKRYAARAVGASSLAHTPWLIDWRVDEDGLRACLVPPANLTPAKLESIKAYDDLTNDPKLIAFERAKLFQKQADAIKNKMEGLRNGKKA